MSPLSFFHSVAWWSLVVVVATSAVNVTPPAAGNGATPVEPLFLKDMLDFLGRVKHDETFGKPFFDKLVEEVGKHFDTQLAEKKSYSDYFAGFLENVKDLRGALLKNPNVFGKYHKLTADVILKDFDIFVQWIAVVHREFWVLYFLLSVELNSFDWEEFAGITFAQLPKDQRILDWLTDKVGEVTDRYTVKKGFTDDDLKGDHTSIALAAGNLGISYFGGGPLNYMQYGLFFLSGDDLLPANLASAMLFLAEFCREVNEDKFPEKTTHDKYKCLKDVCKDLAKKIDDFHKLLMPLFNPLTLLEKIVDLEESAKGGTATWAKHKSELPINELYKGKLKASKFDDYVKWITKNSGTLILLLQNLKTDSTGWTPQSLRDLKTHGPFKFGYTFVNVFGIGTVSHLLPHTVDELADLYSHNTLFSLLMCLDHERAVSERRLIEDKTREFRRRRPPPKEAFEDFPIPGEDDEEDGPNDLPNKGKKGGKRRGQRHGQKGGAQDRPQTVPDGGVTKEASFSAYSLRVVTALLALLSVM
ncbi:hypothetical protein BgAZ_207420 [Babesia gibsoni]|uniref:Secreted antigen 1 n=1 Tax=Babesia gibsoni TaxID=33632 RepID=A0AAD8PEI0_BABGI|nr:hypothetical protein BgAZ_207420 [Babesia gibsoni]